MNDDAGAEYQTRRDEYVANAALDDMLRRARQADARVDETEPTAEESKVTAADVASDVGRGIVETPRAVASGVIGAVNEVSDLVNEAGAWIRSKMPEGVNDFEKAVFGEPQGLGQVPNLDDPESNTGKAVQSISKFLTGFVGAGKIKAFQAMKPVTGAGKTAKAAGQGMVADFSVFDPHEDRLSDLVEEVPALANPVTEFLSANEDDSAALGRLKNAVEGLGLGVATDGLVLGLRALRSARRAREVIPEPRRLEDNAFDALGPPKDAQPPAEVNAMADGKPSMAEIPNRMDEALAEATNKDRILTPREQGLDPTYVNFQRIDTPDDIKDVIGRMADEHRIKPTTFKDIELSAEDMNAWEVLSARRKGQPLSASESVAARNLWAASGRKLAEVAKLASDNPSEANLFMFRKMMATHRAVQSEVLDARTETARALASWRIPAGGSAEQLRDITGILEANGGTDLARDLAQRVTSLVEAGLRGEAEEVIERTAWAKTRDAVLEGWINGLLSGPKTHMVNAMSNASVIGLQMAERSVASRISRILGDDQAIAMGEGMAQFHGVMSGLRDGFRYAAKAWKTGESGYGIGKVELPRARAISSENFDLAMDGPIGRSVDFLGSIANVPVRALGASDEFFKTIGYRMELHAQAMRQATREVTSGKIEPDAFKDRMAEIIANPPENIRLQAVDSATYQTFTNTPGPLAQQISKVVHEYPALRIILPFVRTPANIIRYTLERTPLAPAMRHVREDVAAGGARRDLALARIGMGTTLMFSAADMAMNEQITGHGPSNNSERQALMRSGWQPYSVKVGDRYYAYNRLDPMGALLGLSADMVELSVNDDYGVEKQKRLDEAMIAATLSVAQNVTSKTYLSGLSEFFEAMGDPQRYGESYFKRLAGSVVPTGVAEITRIQDPVMRESWNMLDAIRRRTPGMSEDLPSRRDLWGRPISYQSGLGSLYDAVSPIYSKREDYEPIDAEILRLESTALMPSKKMSFDGITVDMEQHPQAWSRFLELSGNELKHPAWRKGAMDLLNDIVSGKHPLSQVYELKTDGPDGGKAEYIREVIVDYRRMAKEQLLDEFPEINSEVKRRKRAVSSISLPQVAEQ